MVSEKKITVEPISFGITGFEVKDLFAKDFVAKLKSELPTSVIAHFCIGFSDGKDIISISHERREGKFNLERVDVEGSDAQLVSHVVKVLKKVLT